MITADELNLVEDALRQSVTSDVGLLAVASDHVIRSGGKRLRPKLVLLSYKAAGGQDISHAIPLAAAVELLHTASLIHDDINDHSDLRRGRATVNAQWGNDLALLVGDFVFVRLLGLIASCDSRVIQAMAVCSTDIVEGETLQVSHLRDMGMTEERYLSIVGKKTASLFSGCSQIGAILAGAAEQQVAALKEYGFNLGIAFQIRDDMLDLVGKSDDLGKPVASDLDQGKVSLATVYAIQASERATEILTLGDRQQVLRMLHDTGAIEYAMKKAREYVGKARASLSVLCDSEAKAELCRLADYAVGREL